MPPKQMTTNNFVRTMSVDTRNKSCSPLEAMRTMTQMMARPYKGLSDRSVSVTPKENKKDALSLVKAVEYMNTQMRMLTLML